MSLLLDMSSRPVLFAWWWERGGDGAPLEIADAIAARALFVRAAASPGAGGRLRALLRQDQSTPAYGLDDGQVLDQLAGSVITRRLRVWELRVIPLTTFGDVEEEAAPEIVVDVAAPVFEEPAPEEEPTFGPGIDAEEIARILRTAAKSGVPFCEECLKQKLIESAREADVTPEDLDAIAAAAVLREAAKTGVPFCEECMKKDLREGRAAPAGASPAAAS